MGMTIDESIENLVLIKKLEDSLGYISGYTNSVASQSLGCAMDTMRKYQKIQEIVKKWELDSWTDNLSYESMIQIREVLEDGNDD